MVAKSRRVTKFYRQSVSVWQFKWQTAILNFYATNTLHEPSSFYTTIIVIMVIISLWLLLLLPPALILSAFLKCIYSLSSSSSSRFNFLPSYSTTILFNRSLHCNPIKVCNCHFNCSEMLLSINEIIQEKSEK